MLIASPLDEKLATRIAHEDERVELLYDPAVVPASRYMGDIAATSRNAGAGQQVAQALELDRPAIERVAVTQPVEHVDELHPIQRLHELAGRADALACALALWELENVIVSPHDTARVPDEVPRQVELFCDNLRRYLAVEDLRNRVDLELLY